MQLEVKSYPAGEIITDLANHFESDLTEFSDEYIATIPSSIGSGEIRGISFPSGLGIISFNCRFNQELVVKFSQKMLHPAKFIYVNKGHLKHRLFTEDETYIIKRFQTAIVASKKDEGHIMRFSAFEDYEICILEIDRSILISRIIDDVDTLRPELRQMLEDTGSKEDFHHRAFYSLDMRDIFEGMMKREDQHGLVKKLYLEGKTFDILSYQLAKYQKDVEGSKEERSITDSEIDTIHQAVTHIKNNLDKEITVKQLTKITGLNPNKLQAGFKELCGFTVHDYLKSSRLRAAKEMILHSDLTISEIVYKIGLVNRGYFSKLFKTRYGLSPTEFRKKNGSSNT